MKIKIEYNGVEARISPDRDLTVKELIRITNTLEKSLSYQNNAIAYNNKFSWGEKKETNIILYNRETHSFWTGLLPRVYKDIRNLGHEVELTSNHPYLHTGLPPEDVTPISLVLPEWFYGHQVRLIQEAFKSLRCRIQSPTGSGKTIALAWFIKHFPHVHNILVVVPYSDLLDYTHKEVEKHLGEKVGRVGDRSKELRRVTVATLKGISLLDNQDYLNSIKVLVVDECHTIGDNKTSRAALLRMPNTVYRLGLSATVDRELGDDRAVEGLIGPTTLVVKEKELVDLGLIVPPTYCTFKIDSVDVTYPRYNKRTGAYNTKNSKPDYRAVYATQIIHHDVRNRLIATLAKSYLDSEIGSILPCLILCQFEEHAQVLQEQLAQVGVECDWFSSKNSKPKERAAMREELERNERRIVIATPIFNTGINVPALGLGIIAGGGSSENRIVQQAGRFVRKHELKRATIVVDFEDTEPYYLYANYRERLNSLNKRFPNCERKLKSVREFEGVLNGLKRVKGELILT